MTIKYQEKNKLFYWTCFTLFFVGLAAVTGGIFLFENTIVSWKIPVIIFLLAGFLMTPITSNGLEKHCKIENHFLKIFFNLISFGGTLVGLLIAINYYITSKEENNYKVEIIKIHYSSRNKRSCKIPYADVEINNTYLSLAFPCGFELSKYKFIEINTKKGLLGFDIVISKTPTIQ